MYYNIPIWNLLKTKQKITTPPLSFSLLSLPSLKPLSFKFNNRDFSIQVFAEGAILFDNSNLKKQNSDTTKAYDIIKIQEAWDIINAKKPNISPVKIGIIDTGVDSLHTEFSGVTVGDIPFGKVDFLPMSENNDTERHGTHVAGIIGVNNLSGEGVLLESE